jgi:rhodanese-related sulfurtransferase
MIDMIEQLAPLDLRVRMEAGDIQLVDVREVDEYSYCRIEGAVHIPMARLLTGGEETLDSRKAVVCYCHHGYRSQTCAEYLAFRGFREIYNLRGGIHAWSLQVDPAVPRY